MRLQHLVVALLAACASTRAQGQVVARNTATPPLAGPHNIVLNGVRFFYSVGGTAAARLKLTAPVICGRMAFVVPPVIPVAVTVYGRWPLVKKS